MIAIIADDLSGAAELANAALEAGFSAEVQLRFDPAAEAEVICVDTATRSLPPEAAARRVAEVAQSMAAAKPEFVYKKCDSVLRGSVAAEALAIARACGQDRVLLIPANPSRHRLIRGGQYFINDTPLAQTAFATDPEYPRRTSSVAELLGPAPGITIPDIASATDLVEQARTLDAATLAAGGVDFFLTLMRMKWPGRTREPDQAWRANGLSLFVCGSHAAWLADRAGQCAQHGITVLPMPRPLFEPGYRDDVLVRWANFAATSLRQHGALLLALGGEEALPGVTSEMLVERLAQAVELVLTQVPVARVFLEGGATALAVVRQLGLDRFHAHTSPGQGTGTLRPAGQDGPIFLIKPGSYPWPESVWHGA